MKSRIGLYHALPGPLRSVAASTWGYYLRYWRYSSETESLIEQAKEREHWSSRQWEVWTQERLGRLLQRAATQVPYYAEYWRAQSKIGLGTPWTRVDSWPILKKDVLRRDPKRFIATDHKAKRMFHVHTSGTTGKPVSLWRSLETNRNWYALFEARVRRWYDISEEVPWANIGGQLVAPVNVRRPPFWVWNAALRQLYLSSYHLAADLIPYYIRALQEYRIECLLGYSSSLYALARQLVMRKQALPMRLVITNAEPLFEYQRTAIQEAFQCPVRETYGMAEIAAAASECASGRLHYWPDAGYIEILNGNASAVSGESGDIVTTGLVNMDMPLIRYATGDRARLDVTGVACTCGRTLPLIEAIDGRSDDVLYTVDGRQVGRLDPVFKADLNIQEAQIVQESLAQLRVRYVPAPEFGLSDERSVTDRIRERMGDIRIEMEPVTHIPREANGKFRAVVCKLSREERELLSVS